MSHISSQSEDIHGCSKVESRNPEFVFLLPSSSWVWIWAGDGVVFCARGKRDWINVVAAFASMKMIFLRHLFRGKCLFQNLRREKHRTRGLKSSSPYVKPMSDLASSPKQEKDKAF